MQHEPRCPVSGAREPRQGDYEDGVRALSPLENSCRQSRRCSTFPHARRSYEETRSTRWHVHASDKLQGEKEEKKKDEKSEEKKVEKKEDEKGGASRTVVSVFGQVACQKEKTKGITDERRRIIHDHPAFFPPLSALPESVLVVATTVAATAVAITTSSIVTVLVVVLGRELLRAPLTRTVRTSPRSWLTAPGYFRAGLRAPLTKGKEREEEVGAGVGVEKVRGIRLARLLSVARPVARSVASSAAAEERSLAAGEEAGLGLGGSDAGPPAARNTRPQHGLSARVRHDSFLLSSFISLSPTLSPYVRFRFLADPRFDRWTEERKEDFFGSIIGESQQRRERRGEHGDVRVPDLVSMRLDSPGLTGPPTTTRGKRKRKKKKTEEDDEEQQLHGEHEDGPAARNATAFRASRHPPFRSVVRARYHAVTPTLEAEQGERRADRLSATRPQRRRWAVAPTSQSRKKRGLAGRRRRSSLFNDRIFLRGYTVERFSVRSYPASNGFANSAIFLTGTSSSLDVLANTAFNDDDDDEDETENISSCRRPAMDVFVEPSSTIEIDATRCHSWTIENSGNGIGTDDATVVDRDASAHLSNANKNRESSSYRLQQEEDRSDSFEERERVVVDDFDFERERKRRKGRETQGNNEYPDGFPQSTLSRREGNWSNESNANLRIVLEESNSRIAHRRCQEQQRQQQQQQHHQQHRHPYHHHHHQQQQQQLPRRGRNYGLLLLLYLLTWPLLCSSNSSSQHPSSAGFGQKAAALSSGANLIRERNDSDRNNRNNHNNSNNNKTAPRGSPLSSSSNDAAQQYIRSDEDDQRRYRQEADSKAQQMEMEEFYQDQQAIPEITDAHPYNEYAWEVNQINPWLSACDLAGPAPADLQGSCGPPEVPKICPGACASESQGNKPEAGFVQVIKKLQTMEYKMRARKKGISDNDLHGEAKELAKERKRNYEDNDDEERDRAKPDDGERAVPEQCLFYLEESHKRDICRDDFGRASTESFLTPRENRYWFMSGLRLRHCCEHAVVNALAPGKGGPLEDVLNGGRKCADALEKLLLVDRLAARLHCEFEEVLARYDCAQPYSVIHNCNHCKAESNFHADCENGNHRCALESGTSSANELTNGCFSFG
ncbi:hypothetical protein HZH66_004954 [Vespula vulgaris]|uniref:Uncharacterized protein n=1 Tax=Vespula vulgaris TaxID=7454 RepID=A0A834KB57_VESVU|nr:hypothetical protein HZH66_004954 [Vespula vulgaris]